MNWVFNLENKIYTVIMTRVKKAFPSYTDLNFTQDPEPDDATPHFPTVYIHFLPSAEMGRTIDGLEINAIMSTVEIQVTSSKTQGQTVARQIMWETINQFKKLRYELTMSPEVIPTGNDTNQVVCRMRRLVGTGDSI